MATENSDLKERTKTFALSVIKVCKKLENTIGEREIGRQLVRSGMSVGANTRAAFRGRSQKEFVAKLGIVIEEADECGYWFELLIALSEEANKETFEYEKLKTESYELVAIFVSMVKKYKTKS